MTTETQAAYEHITVSPIAGALGAEIGNVDLSKPLDDAVIGEIRHAFLDNLVIFFRDQDITPEQHKTFARHFGDLHINSFFPTVEGHEDVQLLIKEPDDTRPNVGGRWHSDVTYTSKPALGSMLYAKEVPAYGGDTMFANMYLAYETLSDGMKELLRGLDAFHTAAENFSQRAAEAELGPVGSKGFVYSADVEQDAVHPAIRTHPETGRDALYINFVFTKYFVGMTREESAPILKFLCDHLSRPEFTCRFKWEKGSLAFWDNRCAQHFAINDYLGQRRHMNRVTVQGDAPFLASRKGDAKKAAA
jgi:taurine dioxygenase